MKFKAFLNKLRTSFWCWYQGCNGWTGEHVECTQCHAYNPNNTHCDFEKE